MVESKECVVCGAAFERPRGVPPSVWAQRVCCSRACGARLPRKERYVQADDKDCEICGRRFHKPASYRGSQWAARKYCSRACMGEGKRRASFANGVTKRCPVCGEQFTTFPSEAHLHTTCGGVACKRTYRRTVVAAKVSEQARLDYASGKRKPGKGRSRREKDLWPELRAAGWSWGMKWTDAWGTFELDFSLPDHKLNVEIDGVEHAWTKRRSLDALRDAELERRGWRILRVTNEDVDADPAAVVARVLAWADSP